MKAATSDLHSAAETSGAVKEIIEGTISRGAYGLYLRNLLPIYEALEASAAQQRSPVIKQFMPPNLHRAETIRADLNALLPGQDWTAQPVLAAAEDYIRDIAKTAQGRSPAILGHIYVRYLGDLHGGQILKTLLGQRADFPAAGLSFYDFPQITDLKTFRRRYRTQMNELQVSPEHESHVISAALSGFTHNIEISTAISRQSV